MSVGWGAVGRVAPSSRSTPTTARISSSVRAALALDLGERRRGAPASLGRAPASASRPSSPRRRCSSSSSSAESAGAVGRDLEPRALVARRAQLAPCAPRSSLDHARRASARRGRCPRPPTVSGTDEDDGARGAPVGPSVRQITSQIAGRGRGRCQPSRRSSRAPAANDEQEHDREHDAAADDLAEDSASATSSAGQRRRRARRAARRGARAAGRSAQEDRHRRHQRADVAVLRRRRPGRTTIAQRAERLASAAMRDVELADPLAAEVMERSSRRCVLSVKGGARAASGGGAAASSSRRVNPARRLTPADDARAASGDDAPTPMELVRHDPVHRPRRLGVAVRPRAATRRPTRCAASTSPRCAPRSPSTAAARSSRPATG